VSCQFHAIATGKSLGSAGVVNQRPELQRLLKFMLSFPLKLASTLHNKPRSERPQRGRDSRGMYHCKSCCGEGPAKTKTQSAVPPTGSVQKGRRIGETRASLCRLKNCIITEDPDPHQIKIPFRLLLRLPSMPSRLRVAQRERQRPSNARNRRSSLRPAAQPTSTREDSRFEVTHIGRPCAPC